MYQCEEGSWYSVVDAESYAGWISSRLYEDEGRLDVRSVSKGSPRNAKRGAVEWLGKEWYVQLQTRGMQVGKMRGAGETFY